MGKEAGPWLHHGISRERSITIGVRLFSVVIVTTVLRGESRDGRGEPRRRCLRRRGPRGDGTRDRPRAKGLTFTIVESSGSSEIRRTDTGESTRIILNRAERPAIDQLSRAVCRIRGLQEAEGRQRWWNKTPPSKYRKREGTCEGGAKSAMWRTAAAVVAERVETVTASEGAASQPAECAIRADIIHPSAHVRRDAHAHEQGQRASEDPTSCQSICEMARE